MDKEYKERFCPACRLWKSGRFYPVRNKGRINYYRCSSCEDRRNDLKLSDKKIEAIK